MNKQKNKYPVMSYYDKAEFIGEIIDIFEDFLAEKGIDIPNPEKEENQPLESAEEQAIIYGTDFDDLESNIETLLINWDIIDSRKRINMNLTYLFFIEERVLIQQTYEDRYISHNLPHENEIKAILNKEWNHVKPYVIKSFDNIIIDMIDDIQLSYRNKKDGRLQGVFTIIPKPNKRWSQTTRGLVWDGLNGQMTDGFGEVASQLLITTDSENEYYIEI